MKKQYQWTFWGIIVIAFVWRVVGVSAQAYWMDEGYSIAIAQAILNHGYPLLDSGVVSWRDPLFHYLLAAVVAVGGTTEWATRFLSIVAGTAMAALIGVIGKEWFSRRVGLIAMLLTAFSQWEIAWSRQARMYMLLQLLFWFTLWQFERWYRDRAQKGALVLTILGSVCAALTHQFGVLVLLAIALRVLFDQLFSVKRSLSAALFVYLLVNTALICVAAIGVQWLYDFPGAVQYWSHYSAFLTREHLIMLFLATGGIVYGVNRSEWKQTIWLATVFLLMLGMMSYAVILLHYRYLFFVFPVVLLLASVCVDGLWNHGWLRVLMVVAAVLMCFRGELVTRPLQPAFLESDPITSSLHYKSFSPQPDFGAAYAWIAENALTDQQIITAYPILTRLYLHGEDTIAIYADLVGQYPEPTRDTEVYTGIPFLRSVEQLRDVTARHHGYIMIDDFARRRMNAAVWEHIQGEYELVYQGTEREWSQLWVYRF